MRVQSLKRSQPLQKNCAPTPRNFLALALTEVASVQSALLQRARTPELSTWGSVYAVETMKEKSYIYGLDGYCVLLAAGSGVVTDISSGKEMSLEEFDRALGLHTALEVRPGCFPSLDVTSRQAWPLQSGAAAKA